MSNADLIAYARTQAAAYFSASDEAFWLGLADALERADDAEQIVKELHAQRDKARAELSRAYEAWSQDAHLRDAALDRLDAVRAALGANVPAWSYDLGALRGHLRSIIDGDGSVRPVDACGTDPVVPGPEPR